MSAKIETVCDTAAESYRHWTEVELRYGDTDRQGHINNAVFCTLLESGRVDFLFDRGGEGVCGEGKNFVIARLTLDYLNEMNFPGTARIGSRVLTIGRTSFKVGQAIFLNEQCCCTAESVIVLTDEKTRKSTPLTEALLKILQELK